MAGIRKELSDCIKLLREAEDIYERIERLHSMLERTTTTLRVDAGGNRQYHDILSEGIAKLDELERIYAAKAAAYIEQVKIAELMIESLCAVEQRQVLRLRYIDGLVWDQISEKMGFSPRTCHSYHDEAIKRLEICI